MIACGFRGKAPDGSTRCHTLWLLSMCSSCRLTSRCLIAMSRTSSSVFSFSCSGSPNTRTQFLLEYCSRSFICRSSFSLLSWQVCCFYKCSKSLLMLDILLWSSKMVPSSLSSRSLKDLFNANACWLVLIYDTLIITYVAKRISKYASYIL